MVTSYGPPYFYVGLAEAEMREEELAKELVPTCQKRTWSKEEQEIQTEIGRLLTLTERTILARLGKEELMKVLKNAEDR